MKIIGKESPPANLFSTKTKLYADEVDAVAVTTGTMNSLFLRTVTHRGRLEGTSEPYSVCAPRGSLSFFH